MQLERLKKETTLEQTSRLTDTYYLTFYKEDGPHTRKHMVYLLRVLVRMVTFWHEDSLYNYKWCPVFKENRYELCCIRNKEGITYIERDNNTHWLAEKESTREYGLLLVSISPTIPQNGQKELLMGGIGHKFSARFNSWSFPIATRRTEPWVTVSRAGKPLE